MPARLTQEEVISRLINIYGDTLDFSKVEYEKNTVPICVICPIHGEQWIRPDLLFTNKNGCRECSKERKALALRLPTDEIIRRATEVHNGYFTYDKQSIDNAKNMREYMVAFCPIHGKIEVQIESHLHGCGCIKCSRKEKKNTESYIAEAKEIWGDEYDYSPLQYVDSHSYITFRCLKHGLQTIKACDHLHGHGCPKCGNERKSNWKKIPQEEYIKEVSKVHSNYYSYLKTQYKGMHEDIIVTCPIHNDFEIEAVYHLQGGGCPYCTKLSKGETLVRNWLLDNEIEFIPQYKIEPRTLLLFGRNKFKVDFYLPKWNIIIEYHGEQHYIKSEFFHQTEEDFQDQQDRDRRLREYCNQKGIKLIEIPYTKLKEIDSILDKKIGRLK